MDKQKQYCNNCGNYGHAYKSCRHPVLSYGILLFHKDDQNIFRIVMVERKDSIAFIEFIRGKYKSHLNIEYLKILFSRFSIEERKKVLLKSFNELWNELWIHTETINDRIKREYRKSSEMFYKLKGTKLKELIDSVETNYKTNEWEIPKGRRKKYEANKDTAIREFSEETNIDISKYELFNNIIPIFEEYKGINNVNYKHIYYIGKTKEKYDLKINKLNKDQYTEIKNINWLTKNECHESIRDHDNTKHKLIDNLFNFLEKHESLIDFN